VSGQYILQANSARFNQNQVDTICQLCGEEEENMEHFLLKCTILQAVRYSVLDDIDTEFNIITGKMFYNLDSYLKIQILLDCSVLLNYDNPVCKDKLLLKQLTQLESQCRRFIYIVTVCVFVPHLFSWYPFYFDFHSARIIFYVSSGFYLWNINKTTAWHL
jgi:hypothetical protein